MLGRNLAAAALLVLAGCGEKDLGPSVLGGRYTNAQADRGHTVYVEHCLSCHGVVLEGDDSNIPAIGYREFRQNWGIYSLGALYEFISTTMPDDEGSGDMAGSLTPQQYADVLAFVLRFNGYPAGTEELLPGTEALRSIRFVPLD